MKIRHILPLVMMAGATLSAMADIVVTSATPVRAKLISIPIAEYAKGRNAIETILTDSLTLEAGASGKLNTPTFNAVNMLAVEGNDNERETFYTAPGDEVTVTINSTLPLDVSLAGTPLLAAMEQAEAEIQPVMQKYEELRAANAVTEEVMEQIFTDYDRALIGLVNADPASVGATYAVMQMQRPETLVEMFGQLPATAKSNILYPLAEANAARAKRSLEAEARQKALESGVTPAPDFTLPDLQGNKVTLSSLRGKWVILDFWGSWCIWCIKGFPALKDAYAQYGDKLEIVGIDCGDSPEAWKAAVEKYKLPWMQLYNADAPDSIDKTYGIQGFPTKMILNPEGKIVNITTGEDPSFFEKLDAFINK